MLFLIFFFECNSQRNYPIQDEFWKYSNGYYIGDVIDYRNNTFKVDRNSKIYKKGNWIATIKSINNKKMEIISQSGEKGYYVLK